MCKLSSLWLTIQMPFQNKQHCLSCKEQIITCLWVRVRDYKGQEGNVWAMEIFSVLIAVVVTSSKASVLQCSAFLMVQLSHSYMTTGKIIALTICAFVSKMTSLLFNMLSRFVIAFLPWSTHLLIWFYSWANQPGPKVKSHHCSTLTCGSKDSYKDHQDQAPGPSSRGKSRIPNTLRWWVVWWRHSPNPLDSLISEDTCQGLWDLWTWELLYSFILFHRIQKKY